MRFVNFLALAIALFSETAPTAEPINLQLRHRVEVSPNSHRFHAITKTESWSPEATALLICDVWDLHTSRNATLRTGELAPRIDRLAKELRSRGVTVIHCPSDTMSFYERHPARLAAIKVPKAETLPPDIGQWCYSIPSEEKGEYPLDQSDGGQDDDPEQQRLWAEELSSRGRKTRGPWIKQHEDIAIVEGDFITDRGDEVWSILENRGIDNVLMTGVHTNMCVLGRPFGLRRLASNGKNVALVRDLTDTMYNPAKRPYVSHFTGTDLIVQHIEKYVCPTITSDQILGGESFVFANDDRPHLVIVMSEPEYETEETLPEFARRHLGRDFQVSLVFGDEQDGNDLPGLEILQNADLLLISMRRRALAPEQMQTIRNFLEAGKPVVGIRTSSHALSLRGKQPPEGRVTWESFDADIFGGNYSNHYGNGPITHITAAENAKAHPVLTGVTPDKMKSSGSLYIVSPLAESASPLLIGRIEGKSSEPVAWSNTTKFGGRAFYTSLGHVSDFEQAGFRRLLYNSLFWSLGRDVPGSMPDAELDAQHESVENQQSRVDGYALPEQANVVSYVASEDDRPTTFDVPDGLEWELVLSEPQITQPVFIDFDERGRLWVAQYRQYPSPAGLKMLSKDKFWRAVYDKIPEAPPHHVAGADKISIHEDTNGDGVFDSHKTFVEGLSIVTSFARGRGGVFVLNPPYLLFYPDRNNDDVPDSDPEVLLAGFGLEDTHSCANSLRFGPDGWLYACQGSTVSGQVTRPGTADKPVATMGQLIWRYHPERRVYEVFAEGGGNAFGIEIDSNGNIFSGHNGGNTRGFHYIQGGYYRKGFDKHGPLSNPHTYGFFEPMKHPPVERFTHDFVIYEENALPQRYHGKLFGVEPLQGRVTLTDISRNGSTFETDDVDHVVRASEGSQFRPVHITTGPDGAIYVADFHEEYISHRDHFEGRISKDTGRIYRLGPRQASDTSLAEAANDLSTKTSAQLVETLDHPNRWQRATALRLLSDRPDQSVVGELRRQLLSSGGQGLNPLWKLWAIYQLGGLETPTLLATLDHANPQVRSWAVRLACDGSQPASLVTDKLAELAISEPDIRVRVQLASSARRLPAKYAFSIVRGLISHAEDKDDPFLPLSLWWAIEAKCETEPDEVVQFLQTEDFWSHALSREVIAERIMRRFASGDRSDLVRCGTLLNSIDDPSVRSKFLSGLEMALRGRSAVSLPDTLTSALAETGELPLSLRVRQGDSNAVAEAFRRMSDPKSSVAERVELVELLGSQKSPAALSTFLSLFKSDNHSKLQLAALAALAPYDEISIAQQLIDVLPVRNSDQQIAIISILVSRPAWASALVDAIRLNRVDKQIVPADLARRLLFHDRPSLSDQVLSLWPELNESSRPRGRRETASLASIILEGSADPYRGKRLFLDSCGRCHKLFNVGGDVGPDLTADPRNDLSRLLIAVTAPSAEVREGFETYVAVTDDGRVISGLLIDQDDHVVVIREADGRDVILERDGLEELVRQTKSLMPDGLLDQMSDQEVRDLFAYLRTSQPLND